MTATFLSDPLTLIDLPTEFLSQNAGARSRAPVSFGTEREGFTVATHPDNPKKHYAHIATGITAETGIPASADSPHVHEGFWRVKAEEHILPDKRTGLAHIKTEVTSRILRGHDGLEEIDRVHKHLDEHDFLTNNSCGLHIHVSLGWKPGLRGGNLGDVQNIYKAFQRNKDFFTGLVPAHRHGNSYSRINPDMSDAAIDRCTTLVDLIREAKGEHDKHLMLNLMALRNYGTIEYKLADAEHTPEKRRLVGFLVAFTYEAAHDPDVRSEQVIARYFRPDIRPGHPNRYHDPSGIHTNKQGLILANG